MIKAVSHKIDVIPMVMEVRETFYWIEVVMHVIDVLAMVMEVMDIVIRLKL